jgi:hypothetical protein
MFDWIETSNGNYVHVFGDDDLMTVYKDTPSGKWKGIYDGNLLIGSYDTPEEAQAAMERFIEGDTKLVMQLNGTGRSKKDGNYYQRSRQGVFKVKQAKSGKWYVSVNGKPLSNIWLDSEEAAIKKANELVG